MRGFKSAVLISAVYITVCLAVMPETCIFAVKSALELCGTAVIPTLFPFFVCSSLFVSLGVAEYASKYLGGVMQPVFHTGGAGAVAVVLGIISGYPVGAKCAADLYCKNKLSKAEAERLLAFCNNSGPMFIMGTVGIVMYHSMRAGVLLYAIHITSSVLTGIIYSRIHKGERHTSQNFTDCETFSEPDNIFAVIGSAVSGSVNTILKVCGFVIFFAVIGATLPNFGGSEFIYSFLEITGGINNLTALSFDSALKFSLVSMFLALSGVSVLFQVGAIISEYGISIRAYITGKSIQAVLAFTITYILCQILKYLNRLEWFLGADSSVFSLSDASMGTADTVLWNLSGAIEACGLCAAVIFAMILLYRFCCDKKSRIK